MKKARPVCADCGHKVSVHWDGICGAEGCAEWKRHPDSRCPSARRRRARKVRFPSP